MSVRRLELAELLDVPADLVDEGPFFLICESFPADLQNLTPREELGFERRRPEKEIKHCFIDFDIVSKEIVAIKADQRKKK